MIILCKKKCFYVLIIYVRGKEPNIFDMLVKRIQLVIQVN